ncbi:MAG: nucleotidyl transferase AbiEii/AbiGii toxin family protein [Anaerolineae bacterium]|nr:nucleotidyl transferase AbiEii/AbiGii toxin family protein [Anaerolineae bacterium]
MQQVVKLPRRPTHLSGYAELCLNALSAAGLGDKVSIGGALGLLHYLDYRPTHDVDAWWMPMATGDERQAVIHTIEETLRRLGEVRVRAWGDVVSIELACDDRRVFSFQIAERSAQLRPSLSVAWTDVLLDSFPDLVASKMVALVERGAPRDFRDIHAVCQAGLTNAAQCWQWWRERQRLVGSDEDAVRARLAVETHLARIAQHRPLTGIKDAAERAKAEHIRGWFLGEFLDALVD